MKNEETCLGCSNSTYLHNIKNTGLSELRMRTICIYVASTWSGWRAAEGKHTKEVCQLRAWLWMQNKGFWTDAEEPTSQKWGYRDSTAISYTWSKRTALPGNRTFKEPQPSRAPLRFWSGKQFSLTDSCWPACCAGRSPSAQKGSAGSRCWWEAAAAAGRPRGPAPAPGLSPPTPCGQAPGQQSIPARQARWASCCTCSSRSSRPTATCWVEIGATQTPRRRHAGHALAPKAACCCSHWKQG